MKRIFSLAFVSLLALGSYAQKNLTPPAPGVTYGTGTTATGALDVALLESKMGTATTYDGKVQGVVKSVCTKKGCWMKLSQAGGDDVMIRFKDYKFFMPQDIVGKTVVLEGVAEKTTTSVEMLRHYAEDAGKSKEEIEKITQEKKEIEFIANGVLVVS